MFRNLKQKLGDSLANSAARNLLLVDQGKQVSASVFILASTDRLLDMKKLLYSRQDSVE